MVIDASSDTFMMCCGASAWSLFLSPAFCCASAAIAGAMAVAAIPAVIAVSIAAAMNVFLFMMFSCSQVMLCVLPYVAVHQLQLDNKGGYITRTWMRN
jgi:hypothetical protein